MSINALSNCLGEICEYIGEDPLNFLEQNIFYFNRKLENRKKFFLNISLNKNLAKAENLCKSVFPDELFSKILEEIKNVLRRDNLISCILREIASLENVFGKKNLYELIIPFKERIDISEVKLNELFKFYSKNLKERNQEELIKFFLDKLLNPKNYWGLKSKLCKYSGAYDYSFNVHFVCAVNIDLDANDRETCKKRMNHFISKYYVEKMKNMYDVGQEFGKKQDKFIC